MDTIKAIFIAPQCAPQWIDLPKSEPEHYNNVRALVGGIIDVVSLGEDGGRRIDAIINDEGLLHGLPPNVRHEGRLLVGNIVVTAERPFGDEGDSEYCDLPENALEVVNQWLAGGTRPGRFEYDIPPARVFFGKDFEKAMAGDIPPGPTVRIVSADVDKTSAS